MDAQKWIWDKCHARLARYNFQSILKFTSRQDVGRQGGKKEGNRQGVKKDYRDARVLKRVTGCHPFFMSVGSDRLSVPGIAVYQGHRPILLHLVVYLSFQ